MRREAKWAKEAAAREKLMGEVKTAREAQLRRKVGRHEHIPFLYGPPHSTYENPYISRDRAHAHMSFLYGQPRSTYASTYSSRDRM